MTPARRNELLAASRLGRLVSSGTELPPDQAPPAEFWNEDQPREHGRWASSSGENAAPATDPTPDLARKSVEGSDWKVVDDGVQSGVLTIGRPDGRTLTCRKMADGYTIATYRREHYTPQRPGTKLNLEIMDAVEHTEHRVVRDATGNSILSPAAASALIAHYPKANPLPAQKVPPTPAAEPEPASPTPPSQNPAPRPFLEQLAGRPRGKQEAEKLKAALVKHGVPESEAKRVHDLSRDNPGTRQQALERAAKYIASTLAPKG